jgi:hypothetical protein
MLVVVPGTAIIAMLVAEDEFLTLAPPRGITLAEFEFFTLDLDFTWPGPGAVSSAEYDVIALDFAHFRGSRARLLPVSNPDIGFLSVDFSRAAALTLGAAYGDIVTVKVPHGRRRGWATTTDHERVLVEVATAARGPGFLIPRSYHQLARIGPAVVLSQREVGSAPSGVGASREFDIELVVAAVAAVAVAIEVALALLVELGRGIAARHGVDEGDEKAVGCSAGSTGWAVGVGQAGRTAQAGGQELSGGRRKHTGGKGGGAGFLRRAREEELDAQPGKRRGELALVGCSLLPRRASAAWLGTTPVRGSCR